MATRRHETAGGAGGASGVKGSRMEGADPPVVHSKACIFEIRREAVRVKVKEVMSIDQACIKLSILPRWEGGGIKSKGLELGKKIKSLKRRKKKFFEDLTLLAVPKGKMKLLKHNLTLLKPKIYCFIALRVKKSEIL